MGDSTFIFTDMVEIKAHEKHLLSLIDSYQKNYTTAAPEVQSHWRAELERLTKTHNENVEHFIASRPVCSDESPSPEPAQAPILASDSCRNSIPESSNGALSPKESPHSPRPPQNGKGGTPNNYRNKPNNWASLFRSQGPSKSMKLEHFPELQQEKKAVVKLDAAHLDEITWRNCLVGYFLDGRMDFPLVHATAFKVWKEFGLISAKTNKSGLFYFQFKDQESLISVLEGGPWYFSGRYIVLKNRHRMMPLSVEHPSKIPAWVRFHNLPLECWTADSFSRIASTIGRPIHVDKATERRQRISSARICIEIDAKNVLPDSVEIQVDGESVVVNVEYQFLPPICSECKVFGHPSSRCTKHTNSNSSKSKPGDECDEPVPPSSPPRNGNIKPLGSVGGASIPAMGLIPDDGDHENMADFIPADGPQMLPKAGTPPMEAGPSTPTVVCTTNFCSSLAATSDDSPFLPASQATGKSRKAERQRAKKAQQGAFQTAHDGG